MQKHRPDIRREQRALTWLRSTAENKAREGQSHQKLEAKKQEELHGVTEKC